MAETATHHDTARELHSLLDLDPDDDDDHSKYDNEAVRKALLRFPSAALARCYRFKWLRGLRTHPLVMAASLGASLDVVAALHDAHPDAVRFKMSSGMTALHCACRSPRSRPEVVRYLVDRSPAEALSRGEAHYGRTPLHYACRSSSSADVVDLLARKNPGVLGRVDKLGRTPLHVACRWGASPEVVKALVALRPEAAARKASAWRSMLHVACANGADVESVRALVDAHPAAVARKDKAGLTPLHCVCASGEAARMDVVRLLAERHPKALEEPCGAGYRPIVYAEESRASLEFRALLETLGVLLLFQRVSDEMALEMLRKDAKPITWKSRKSPILDDRPSLVHRMDLNHRVLPTLFEKIGRECKLQTMFHVIRGRADLCKDSVT